MCAIAQPKHCQTKPAVSYGSFQRRIIQSCQKFALWGIGFLFTDERWPWIPIFATLITQWLDVFLPDTSNIPLETNVDVTSSWPRHDIPNRELCSVALHITLEHRAIWFTAQGVDFVPCPKTASGAQMKSAPPEMTIEYFHLFYRT